MSGLNANFIAHARPHTKCGLGDVFATSVACDSIDIIAVPQLVPMKLIIKKLSTTSRDILMMYIPTSSCIPKKHSSISARVEVRLGIKGWAFWLELKQAGKTLMDVMICTENEWKKMIRTPREGCTKKEHH